MDLPSAAWGGLGEGDTWTPEAPRKWVEWGNHPSFLSNCGRPVGQGREATQGREISGKVLEEGT